MSLGEGNYWYLAHPSYHGDKARRLIIWVFGLIIASRIQVLKCLTKENCLIFKICVLLIRQKAIYFNNWKWQQFGVSELTTRSRPFMYMYLTSW